MIEILSQHWTLVLLFFVIALLYSSVGFGGGSSYLAILALTGIAFTEIRSIALLCNIAVVTGNILHFYKRGLYDWKKVIPLALISVPLAFLGGYLKISQTFFFILLGFTLLFAAITMWLSKRFVGRESSVQQNKPLENISYGGIIGFISGMVGIGGGIFLAPLLHLRQWDTPKRIAATASFFILVNSISGFTGQLLNADFNLDWKLTTLLLFTVLMASFIGNKLRDTLFSPILLKKSTALLVAFVGIRILIQYFF